MDYVEEGTAGSSFSTSLASLAAATSALSQESRATSSKLAEEGKASAEEPNEGEATKDQEESSSFLFRSPFPPEEEAKMVTFFARNFEKQADAALAGVEESKNEKKRRREDGASPGRDDAYEEDEDDDSESDDGEEGEIGDGENGDDDDDDGECSSSDRLGGAFEGTPRDYQTFMVEHAKKENIIVHLGTGMGKTLIGIMLIREYLSLAANDNRDTNDSAVDIDDAKKEKTKKKTKNRHVLFLVPSVVLAIQHCDNLRSNIDAVVEIACHDTTGSARSREKIASSDVIVATHGAALDLLRHYPDVLCMSEKNEILVICNLCVKRIYIADKLSGRSCRSCYVFYLLVDSKNGHGWFISLAVI